jgi:hypothetical protein
MCRNESLTVDDFMCRNESPPVDAFMCRNESLTVVGFISRNESPTVDVFMCRNESPTVDDFMCRNVSPTVCRNESPTVDDFMFRNESPTVDAGVHAAHHVPLHVDLQHGHHGHDGTIDKHRSTLCYKKAFTCIIGITGLKHLHREQQQRVYTSQELVLPESVADPGCLSRIPGPGSRISDSGSRIQKQQQKRGVKKFFVAINFTTLKIILFLKY